MTKHWLVVLSYSVGNVPGSLISMSLGGDFYLQLALSTLSSLLFALIAWFVVNRKTQIKS